MWKGFVTRKGFVTGKQCIEQQRKEGWNVEDGWERDASVPPGA